MRIDSVTGGSSLLWVTRPPTIGRGKTTNRVESHNTFEIAKAQAKTTQRLILPELNHEGLLIRPPRESSLGNYVDLYT